MFDRAMQIGTAVAACCMLLAFVCSAQVAHAEGKIDPLSSPVWQDLARKILGAGDIVFDDRVKVIIPPVVENQAQVPVTADARLVPNVTKLVIITDLNPIQHVMTLTPVVGKSEPYISLRLKVEQATPVRAAAQTSDGVWHIGGVFLEAAGGGCSSPAMARKDADWSSTLGDTQGRIWRESNGTARLRLRVRHPMDTGLAKDNTPAFYIEQLTLKNGAGEDVGKLELFEPVAEDPTLTMLIKHAPANGDIIVLGRDNNGTLLRSIIASPWKQSLRPSESSKFVIARDQ